MEVIPAIDLRDGRVVNLVQGDYARETVFAEDAAGIAAQFARAGAPRIHVVDLDAARDGGRGNEDVVRQIVRAAAGVPVQLGGGVRSAERVAEALAWGVERVIVGTAALEQPALLAEISGTWPGRVILGVDAKDGRVAVHGWLKTAELTPAELIARYADLPLAAVLHTDIRRDGMLQGPAVESTAALARQTRLPVIASGGVSSLDDLRALAETGVIAGAIVGRALYTGAFALEDALDLATAAAG